MKRRAVLDGLGRAWKRAALEASADAGPAPAVAGGACESALRSEAAHAPAAAEWAPVPLCAPRSIVDAARTSNRGGALKCGTRATRPLPQHTSLPPQTPGDERATNELGSSSAPATRCGDGDGVSDACTDSASASGFAAFSASNSKPRSGVIECACAACPAAAAAAVAAANDATDATDATGSSTAPDGRKCACRSASGRRSPRISGDERDRNASSSTIDRSANTSALRGCVSVCRR